MNGGPLRRDLCRFLAGEVWKRISYCGCGVKLFRVRSIQSCGRTPLNTTLSQSLCHKISVDLVARGSVTGSVDEQSFGPWLANYLTDLGCFGATPEIWTYPVAPGDGRHVVALLVRGTGVRTVLLTGHYDTVTIDDYGALKPVACQPYLLRDALLARLKGSAEPAEALAFEDLESGEFLPGRGLLDMKGGLAAGLDAIARIVAQGQFSGNLLFLAVPDEENASAGARAAAVALASLAQDKGLSIAAAINLDAISDLGDGADGRVLALGTVGKVLPTAFVVGRPVHSGYTLRGINAAVLAAAIAERLEWAPELTDDSAGVPGTPASLLSFKDSKAGYDVTTPAHAFLFWNVLNHLRDPAAVLDIIAKLADDAARDCLSRLARKAALSGHAIDAERMARSVQIFRYGALLAEVLANIPNAAARLGDAITASSGNDLPERCRQITAAVWEMSGRAGPAVVLGLGSIPYLATTVQDARISVVIDAFLAQASARHGTSLRADAYFSGISDMSFFGQAQDTAFATLAADTPVWHAAIGLAPGSIAQVPTVNLGPWGRDYHTPLERIHVDYGFRILPGLIADLTKRVLADD